MGWLKFLSFAFNLFGVLFFMAAAGHQGIFFG